MKNFMLISAALVLSFAANNKINAQDNYDSDDSAAYNTSYDDSSDIASNTSDVATNGNADVSSTFDSALSPYGTWESDPDYGRVWVPREAVVDTSWRPYVTNGSWVYTDAGWYWNSRYDWGWAPYHYGRWSYGRHHWFWVPGSVWGPSWVSWRYGDGYYGWAPLPPSAAFYPGVGFSYYGRHIGFGVGFGFGLGVDAFTFVPGGSFLSLNLGGAIVPSWRTHGFWDRTRFSNNFGYRNGVFVNNGFSTREVSRVTGRNIQPVHVASTGFRSGISGSSQLRGNTIVSPRATFNTGARGTSNAARAQAGVRTQPRTSTGTAQRRTIQPSNTRSFQNRTTPEARQRATTPSRRETVRSDTGMSRARSSSTSSIQSRSTPRSTSTPNSSVQRSAPSRGEEAHDSPAHSAAESKASSRTSGERERK